MKKQIALLLTAVFFAPAIFCQQNPLVRDTTTTNPARSYIKPALSYLSNAVYQGRKDESVITYITPSISYENKHGFTVGGSLSYQPNRGINEIDLVTFEAGYECNITNALSVEAGGIAYFYNELSTSVKSETKGELGMGMNYSLKDLFSLSAEGAVSFAKKPDIETAFSLAHSFNLGGSNYDFSIAPAVVVQAGTQEYYRNYYSERKFNQTVVNRNQGRRRGNGNSNGNNGNNNNSGSNGTTTEKIINVVSIKTFSILDYELTLPITYEGKKWGAFLTPTYAIPVNPLTYTEDNSATLITENLSNSFFVLAGVFLKL